MFGNGKRNVQQNDKVMEVMSVKEHNEQMRDMQREHDQKVEDIRRHNTQSMSDVKRAHRIASEDFARQEMRARQELISEHVKLIAKINAAHKKTQADADLSHRAAVARLQLDNTKLAEENELKIEDAVNEVRRELEKSVMENLNARIDAEARLATYESFDTKEERKQAADNLKSLLTGVGNMLSNFDPNTAASSIAIHTDGV